MLRSSYYRLFLPLLLVLPVLSCSMNDNNPPSSNTVIILDNSFSPQTMNVAVGRIVVWRNDGSNAHTVTSGTPTSNPGGVFDSGVLRPNGGFTFTFNQAGQYPYFCKIHGVSMSGLVNVR